MKAMILAAGFGTRLRPLTEHCPKALVPVGNRPLLDRNIEYLKSYGVTEIVINVHHFPEQILDHVGDGKRFGIPVHCRVEEEILGTGGGIRNLADFWDEEPFIVLNSDLLTDIDLNAAYIEHLNSDALATLVLHSRDPFNQILVDNNCNLLDIGEKNVPGWLAFTGIHIISPALLDHIPERGFANIIDQYRRLMTSGKTIHGFLSQGHQWHDIGTPSSYLDANRSLAEKEPFLVGTGTEIDPKAILTDWAVLGDSCRVHEGAHITRSVIWDEVTIQNGVRVVDSVVISRRKVTENIIDVIF